MWSKIKRFFLGLWRRFLNFFINLWKDLKDWKTLILFLLVCLVIGSPVWVPLVLGIVFKNGWLIGVASAVESFWLMPFTPFIPLCVAVTLAVKKVLNVYVFSKIPIKKNKNKKSEETNND